jgi:DNA-directed RNA polymerase
MKFLSDLAGALAKEDDTLQCIMPSGLPWANRYDEVECTIIRSKLRGVSVRRKIATGYKREINAADARGAAAPNFIHALDAAHLALVVNVCVAAGIKDLMTIHDCYACLAPQATLFNKIIRDEFVRMYEQHDPLTEIRERALCSLRTSNELRAKGRRVAKVLDFETPGWCPVPKRGDLDLRTFAANVYAFSS